jgi:hypothetical protein
MIRPVTIATCLLACGSGLYLYQSKHQVELLDRKIEQTVHDTTALREQSRLLAAEWTMLNDPERLQQFSASYLTDLKPIAPTQFTSLAELDHRLPAPVAPPPPSSGTTDEPDAGPAVSENTQTVAGAAVVAAAAVRVHPAFTPAASTPAAPTPAAPSPVASSGAAAGRPSETRTAERAPVVHRAARDTQVHPVALADGRPSEPRVGWRGAATRPETRVAETRVAEARMAETRLAEARVAEARMAETRVASVAPPRPIVLGSPRPMPVMAPVSPPPVQYRAPSYAPAPTQPYGGSFLGIARGPMPSSPRPTPVYTYNNAY